MAVINGVGDKSIGIAHAVALTNAYDATPVPSLGFADASGAAGWIETVNLIRPTTGQLYPRGDGVPTT